MAAWDRVSRDSGGDCTVFRDTRPWDKSGLKPAGARPWLWQGCSPSEGSSGSVPSQRATHRSLMR